MSDKPLEEANTKITALEEGRKKDGAVIAGLQERLILSEARDFVNGKLATANLPELTKTRLLKQLLNNPPLKEGRIDQEAYGNLVEAAVTEAQTEVAGILGSGQITGMGSTPGNGAGTQLPKLEESQKRTGAALARLGYKGVSNGN